MTDVSTDTAIANIANVSSGGTGYSVGATVTLEGGTGTAPTYTVSAVAGSAVTSLTLLSAGDLQAFPANPASFSTTASGEGLLANIYLAGTPRSLANRAADDTNVKDFGAAVDGKDSDADAVLSAYNATPNNGIVVIPAGGFLDSLVPSFSGSFTGSISGTTLTVSGLVSGKIGAGSILSGPPIEGGPPPPVVLSQLSGAPNGIGTYAISSIQSVSSGTTLQANKSILIKALGSLDYGNATPGTDPVTSLGDGNVLETMLDGSKYFGKTTTNNTNGYAAVRVDYTMNNYIGGFAASAVNTGIICNAVSNTTGTLGTGLSLGIWAIAANVNVYDSTTDNYALAAVCRLEAGSTGTGAAFYASTTDEVGAATTGAGEFDLFSFGDDPIPGSTEVDEGKRCLVLARLDFQSNSSGSTLVQASRGIAVTTGPSASDTVAIGAMFHGSGSCYYAVFNAANTTSVAGSAVAALRMPQDMGIDFSTVPGTST